MSKNQKDSIPYDGYDRHPKKDKKSDKQKTTVNDKANDTKTHTTKTNSTNIKYIDEVYLPREDSLLLKKAIISYAKGKNIRKSIDVGTGSGIQADTLADYSDETIALDINPKALEYAKKNTKNKDKIEFLKSDMFSSLGKEEYGSFDLIVFNPPYLPDHEKVRDFALDGGPEGFEITKRFIDESVKYLSVDGKILLLFSSLTKKEKVDEFILYNCLEQKEIAKDVMGDGEILYVYEIWKSDILKSLEKRGVSSVYYLAKGHRGIIYTGIYKERKIAIKSKLKKSEVDTICIEIKFLKHLGKVLNMSFVPKLLFYEDDYFAYRFVKGKLIKEYIESSNEKLKKAFVLRMFMITYRLDIARVSKEEMHHPWKHVFIRGNDIKMIDFERCHFDLKPKNVTQLVQFLTTEEMSNLIGIKAREDMRKRLIDKLKTYKEDYSIHSLLDLVSEFYDDLDIKVYKITAKLKKNELITYKGLADRFKIKAYRHIGQIMNANPFAPYVPCYKVVQSDLDIGGYAYGKKEKKRILKKEGFEIQDYKLINIKEDNKNKGIFRRDTKVMVFGTFDLLHKGHEHFLNEAKKHADKLTIVLALDSVVEKVKGHLPKENQDIRLNNLKEKDYVDEVILGMDISSELDKMNNNDNEADYAIDISNEIYYDTESDNIENESEDIEDDKDVDDESDTEDDSGDYANKTDSKDDDVEDNDDEYVIGLENNKKISKSEETRFYFVNKINPDVIALGYDQNDMGLENYIKKKNMNIKIVRIDSFMPEKYKSSIIRK